MFILVVVYMSVAGDVSMKQHPQRDVKSCNAMAKQVFNNVRAGQVRAWCWRKV